ncbi:UNVERIFIED_CONTAM: hypothetical protein GTU68_034321, partial [Idotea baltica]|nr:hypothetical protein [Idotea baltica]
LATVGKFDIPKLSGKYETGQLFLHRVFGYRGAILFPWIARVFDRDISFSPSELLEEPLNYNQVGKEVRGRSHTFYQVLIDVRDCPFIVSRAQTEAVTFLGNQDNGRTLYAVPGLDYVAHEDIMPYTAVDKKPIRHDLFEKFLEYAEGKDPPFLASETLKAWQERNNCWLELSDVHKETTDGIRVTVIPFYMGCRTSHNNSVYWVSCCCCY